MPELTAGLQGFYLGDVTILDKDFSKVTTAKMPHFGNTFSLQASQLIWKGNTIRNGIKIKTLQAKKLLDNIKKFYNQGMVTRNDVIRGELQLSNLQLALQVVNNNHQIINKQLTVALGLDENIKIILENSVLDHTAAVGQLQEYKEMAQNHPAIRLTERSVDIYDVSAKITRQKYFNSMVNVSWFIIIINLLIEVATLFYIYVVSYKMIL